MASHPTVTDDRGKRVPLAPPESPLRVGPGRVAVVARSLPVVTTPEDRRQALRYGLLITPLLLTTSLLPVVAIIVLGVSPWIVIACTLAVSGIECAWLLGVVRRLHARRLARAYAMTGHCGSCAYALDGLKPESDGCRVCPECGAAWRAL